MNQILYLFVKGYVTNDQGKLLIVRRARDNPINPLKITTPGGKIKESESPEGACIREVKEEVGLDVKVIKLRNIKSFKSIFADRQVVIFEFDCKMIDDTQKVILNKEHNAFMWIKEEEYSPEKREKEASLW